MNFDHCISFITVLVTKGMANSQKQRALYPLMNTPPFFGHVNVYTLEFFPFLNKLISSDFTCKVLSHCTDSLNRAEWIYITVKNDCKIVLIYAKLCRDLYFSSAS